MDGDARTHVFERLFAEAPGGLTKLGRLQWVDLESFVTDNLMLKADKLSMAHSLELRVPLLDHHVVEAGLALPGLREGPRRAHEGRDPPDRRASGSAARSPGVRSRASTRRWSAGCKASCATSPATRSRRWTGSSTGSRAERATPAQTYALTMLALWRDGARVARA